MNSFELFLNHIYSWVNMASPTTLWIFSNQANAPEVPQSINHGFINIISAINKSFGDEDYRYNSTRDLFDVTSKNYYETSVSIDVHTVDFTAPDILNRCINFVYSNEVLELFNTNNVGLLTVGSMRNLSTVVSAQISRRFQADFTFSIRTEYTYEWDRIVESPFNIIVEK